MGKTAVAIALAQRLHTAVISADSRQCYREMSIGTAKPAAAEMAGVPHYFIDDYPVTTALTAADYERLALGYLGQVFRHSDTAVVCGGTGLYISALCNGLDEMPPADDQIAEAVNAAYLQHGISWLQQAVAGSPGLQAGNEYVLFIWTAPSGSNYIVGLSQGLFEVHTNASGAVVLTRGPADAKTIDAAGSAGAGSGATLLLSDLQTKIAQSARP